MESVIAFVQEWWVLLTTLVLPFVVNRIASCDWSGKRKALVAAVLSIAVGCLAVLNAGIAIDAANLTAIALAAVGGTQLCYLLFSSVGITNKWLEDLLELGSP